jgi:hypothetical protein
MYGNPFFGTSSLSFNELQPVLLTALLFAGSNWRLLASAGIRWSGQPSPILSPSNDEMKEHGRGEQSGDAVSIRKNQWEVDVPQGAGTTAPSAQ